MSEIAETLPEGYFWAEKACRDMGYDISSMRETSKKGVGDYEMDNLTLEECAKIQAYCRYMTGVVAC